MIDCPDQPLNPPDELPDYLFSACSMCGEELLESNMDDTDFNVVNGKVVVNWICQECAE